MKSTRLLKIIFSIALFLGFGVNAQLSNGLIAHFPFNENCNDISTSGIVGTNNGLDYGTDRNGNSNETISNTGENYVSFNDNAVKTSFPISISVWAKINSHSEINIIFVSDNVFNDYHGYWMSALPSTGQLGINFGGGEGNSGPNNRRSFVTDQSLTVGDWSHIVAIIRDYNDMEVYINCVKSTGTYSGAGPTSVLYSSAESRIGSSIGNNSNPNGNYFNGELDQFAMWNKALSSHEIDTLCASWTTLNTIELSKEELSVLVFPNPANETLYIETNERIMNIQIFSVNGRKNVERMNVKNSFVQLELKDLDAGVYLIKVLTESGNIFTQRFMKD
jgi:hypothetical protein